MTISLWLDEAKDKKKEEFDLIIVGAGITGAAASYWLNKRKDYKVAILDSGLAGNAASGRNGGFVLRGVMAYYNKAVQNYGRDAARWIFKFNEQSLAYLAEFKEQVSDRFFYQGCGSYLLASSLEELQALAESAELMKEDGFELEYLKEDPIERGFYGAIHNPGDVGVNPILLTRALLESGNAVLYEQEEVFEIGWSNNQPVLQTRNRVLTAGRVLLCTNAYLPLISPDLLGLVQPVRGQIMVTRPLESQIIDKLCYANFGYEYFRQLPDGRFLLGGRREPFIEEETGYADMLNPNVYGALQNYLKDKFPEVAGASVDYRWSGTMCFTSDGLPVLGELKDLPGVFYVSGCNGHGMGYAFALSKMLIEFALDGAKPGLFDSRRLLTQKTLTN